MVSVLGVVGCFIGTQHELPLPPLQMLCVCVCGVDGAQGHAASKTRNTTVAGHELKLPAPRHSPTAHHLAPRFCERLPQSSHSALHGPSCLGLYPRVLLPLASSDPQTLELEIVLVLDGP